jgi:hypothetical protein
VPQAVSSSGRARPAAARGRAGVRVRGIGGTGGPEPAHSFPGR